MNQTSLSIIQSEYNSILRNLRFISNELTNISKEEFEEKYFNDINLELNKISKNVFSLKNEIDNIKILNKKNIEFCEKANVIKDELDVLNTCIERNIKKTNLLISKIFPETNETISKYESHIGILNPSILTLESIKSKLSKEPREKKLSDLVEKKLDLSSEKYLLMSEKKYEKMIKKLEGKIQHSSIDESLKKVLLKKVQDHSRQEQRLLLQYLSREDKELVEKERSYISRDKNSYVSEIDREAKIKSRQIMAMSLHINHGSWMELLQENKKNPNFSYQLIALYCEKKISLDELATAMTFDSAYTFAPLTCKIYELNEESLKLNINVQFTEEEKKEWLRLSQSEKIPSNLKYIISNDSSSFDSHTCQTIEDTFLKGDLHTPGVFFLRENKEIQFAMVSFGLAKAYYQEKSTTLAPMIGLSPDRLAMIQRIQLNLSDYALFLRGKPQFTHGSLNSFFAAMHDLLHTNFRAKIVEWKEIYLFLPEALEKEIMPQLRGFQKKLDEGKDEIYPKFVKKPTKMEITGYVLDRILGDMVDGAYQMGFEKDKAYEELFELVYKECTSLLNETLKFLKERNLLDQEISSSDFNKELYSILSSFIPKTVSK